ncbi:MAG: alpha-glucosidase C-terminal domain-containing protein, partial [Myxococcota bacterium]
MYYAYARDPEAKLNLGIRRRLAPLMDNDRRRIELLTCLLFTLPGSPILYYGDEIGMGDNIYLGDRNGVRTPMQWSADRNAGFSRANPQKLYLPVIIDPEYHAEAINVESQHANPHSLLWWMKRVIALRRRSRALSRGAVEMLFPENRKVLAFLRTDGDERVLVVANLSRLAQYVELDLSAFNGMTPVEQFGGTEFPRIGELPYLITLGPYAFYWLELTPSDVTGAPGEGELPELEVPGAWAELLEGKHKRALERVLPAYLRTRRWFGSKGRTVKGVEIVETVPVTSQARGAKPVGVLTLIAVEYLDGDPETYVLPLIAKPAREFGPNLPWSAIARLRSRGGEKILFDAVDDPAFAEVLLGAIAGRRVFRGRTGSLMAT